MRKERSLKSKVLPAVSVEVDEAQNEARALPDHGRERRAERAHMHPRDENDVEHDVDDRRDRDEDHRMLRVAHAAQDRADHVVAEDEQHAGRAAQHIGARAFDSLRRHVDEPDEAVRAHDGDHAEHETRAHDEGEQCADDVVQLLFAACADVLRHHDLSGGGKAHAEEGEQVHDVAARGYRGKARGVYVSSTGSA